MARATPADAKLYAAIVREAKQHFRAWPSAYASGWVVKEYKRRGGLYVGAPAKSRKPLARWYREKWINVCELPKIVPCGRAVSKWGDYPYCRPSVKVSPRTPRISSSLTPEEIKARCALKKRAPRRRVTPRRAESALSKTAKKRPAVVKKKPAVVKKTPAVVKKKTAAAKKPTAVKKQPAAVKKQPASKKQLASKKKPTAVKKQLAAVKKPSAVKKLPVKK
jgi:hypothetical protein